MSIEKAVGLGMAGNEISKRITGTSEVSPGRSAIAAVAGTALGAAATSALVITGVVAAPVTIPLAVASGIVSLVASWWG
jgi:hypothetical protein